MLKKYEHSVLSSEELHNFELWLFDLEEFELNDSDYAIYFPM